MADIADLKSAARDSVRVRVPSLPPLYLIRRNTMFGGWIEKIVRRTIKELTIEAEDKFTAFHTRFRTIESLENEISKLKIEKSVREEEFARKEREITHKLGLERMRQEQDLEFSKRTVELQVKEQTMTADEKRFKEQMEFERKHLEGQIKSLEVLVTKVFEKIPEVTHNNTTIKKLTGKANES